MSLALHRRGQGHVETELRQALRELRDCLRVAEQLPSLLDELDAAAGEALRELPPQGRPREDGLRFLAGRVAQVLRQHGFNPTSWSEEGPRGSNTEPLASRFVRCLDVVFSAHGKALSRRQVLRYASDALRA